jgi:hypothetical protein
VAERAREAVAIGLPEAFCSIRWAQPAWSLGKTPVCYLKAASKRLTFGFWQGASIIDLGIETPYPVSRAEGTVSRPR